MGLRLCHSGRGGVRPCPSVFAHAGRPAYTYGASDLYMDALPLAYLDGDASTYGDAGAHGNGHAHSHSISDAESYARAAGRRGMDRF